MNLLRLAVIAVVGFSLGFSHRWAYRSGYDAAEAAQAQAQAAIQRRLFSAADAMSRQAAEIEAFRASQAAMIEEMEHAATTDPGACGLSDAARVRLRSRWNSSMDR